MHLLVQHRHDRLAIEVGGQAAADIGQQRDIAVRQFHAVLLPLHFALFVFDRFLLLHQFAGAADHFVFEHLLLPHQPPDAQAEQQVTESHRQYQDQQAEPPLLPERRHDHHFQRHRLTGPDAILVGRAHPEDIAAGIEVGIGGQAPAAVGIHPLRIEALELVGIAIALRVGEMHGGEFDRKHGVARSQGDRFGGIQRPLGQHVLAHDGGQDRLVENREIGDRHLRRHRVVVDAQRVERGHAGDAAEVHGAVGRLVAGADKIRPVEQAILGGVLLEHARHRIEHVDAARAADPQPALGVAQDGANRIGRTAFAHRVVTEPQLAVGPWFGLAQTGAGTYPQTARSVFIQRLHALVAQAARLFGLVAVMTEFSGLAIKALQAVLGADP